MNREQLEKLADLLGQVYTHLAAGFRYLDQLNNRINLQYSSAIDKADYMLFSLELDCHFDTCDEYGHDEDETEVAMFTAVDKKLYGVTNGYEFLDPLQWDDKTLEKFLRNIMKFDENIHGVDGYGYCH